MSTQSHDGEEVSSNTTASKKPLSLKKGVISTPRDDTGLIKKLELPKVPCDIDQETEVTVEKVVAKRVKKKKNFADELFGKAKKFDFDASSDASSSENGSSDDEIETQDTYETSVKYTPNGKRKKKRNLFNSKSMRDKFLSELLVKNRKRFVKHATCLLTPLFLLKLALSS